MTDIEVKFIKMPIGELLKNPEAPVPEQVAAWRKDFLDGLFFANATSTIPPTVLGRMALDGVDSVFMGMLPDIDHADATIRQMFGDGATWIALIQEMILNPEKDIEGLLIAAYAEGWSDMFIQQFKRHPESSLPMPTEVAQYFMSTEPHPYGDAIKKGN